MAITLTNTSKVAGSRFVALISGASGVGKTSLVKTMNPAETLIVSAESGLLCLNGTDYEVINIENFDDMIEVIGILQNDSTKAKFKNIYIDSLTEILDCLNADMAAKYPDKNKTFQRWDEYFSKAVGLIKILRDMAPYNIVFTSLTSQEKDGLEMKDIFDFPMARLKGKIKSFFDLSLHYKIIETEDNGPQRMLITDEAYSSLAKDRSGKLEAHEEPNLYQIMNKILTA